MPKVFYGSRTRSVTPPSAYGSDESGSEASTDVEVSRRRPAHRRGESVDASQPDPKRPRTRVARDAQGRRALQKACQRNDIDRVRDALAQHVDIEDRDYAGTTALHDAALNGNADIVRLLLQNGAVVDVRSGLEELDTPLMDSVAAGSVEVTQLLIDAGADPRISNAVGKTAIDFLDEDDESASQITGLLEGATRALRAAGTPIIDGPTHPGAQPNLFPPGYEARKRVASTNFIDMTRRTGRGIRTDAVAHAAEGNLAFVGLALERGWKPSAEALVKAAKFGHQEVVGLLLAFGLDADAPFEGQTALKAAVQRGHVSTAQLLLQSGSKLDRKDMRGRTYYDLVADLPAADPMRALIEGSRIGQAPGKTDADSARTPATVGGTQLESVADGTSSRGTTDPPRGGPLQPLNRPTSALRGASPGTRTELEPSESSQLRHSRADAALGDSASREQRTRDRTASTTHGDLHAPRKERVASGKGVRPVSEGPRLNPERTNLSHVSSGSASTADSSVAHPSAADKAPVANASTVHASTSHASAPVNLTDAKSGQRASSRSESRPETFRLADLRAIKPKKRSKSVPDPDVPIKAKEDTPPAVPVAAEPDLPDSSPAASASPDMPRDSPALSPLTEAFPDKSRPPVPASVAAPVPTPMPAEDPPKWLERSNELAELAKRREKQRLAREARMLESLANEERRRSQEPHSPAAQSPLSEPLPSDQLPDAVPSTTQSAPAILAEPVTEPAGPAPKAEVSVPSKPASVPVKHLPFFLRQLSYDGEPRNVGPLFVHFIGATPYYLDVQLAAHAGLPQLHAQYPQWPKVLVTDAHKPVLWAFCRPWAVACNVPDSALAEEEAIFTSLSLVWIPKSVVDETLFRDSPPPTVKIRLDVPKPGPKWTRIISSTTLPLNMQFRAALLRRSAGW